MALNTAIEINESSRPLITKQLLDFRNDSLVLNSMGLLPEQTPLDITGYTFQLVIKRQPVGFRVQDGYPQVYDADTYATRYEGTILDADEGTFTFQLDENITNCYGSYPAEIRWWDADADTSGPPTDRVGTEVLVNRVMDETYSA